MNTQRGVVATVTESGAREEHPEVFERNAPVHLLQRAFDDVLEVLSIEQAGPSQRQQVPPRIGRESPVLVWSLDAEGVALTHRGDDEGFFLMKGHGFAVGNAVRTRPE